MITLTDYDGFSASYNDADFITVTPYTQNGVAGSKIEYITNTYTIEVAYVTSTPSTISGSSIYVQPLTIVLDNGQTEVFYLNPLFYKSYTAVGSNTQLIYEYDQASQPQSYITSTSTSTINAQIAAVMGGGGSGWSLTGNAGTTGSNFIGTTDAQDFVVKTNGTTRGTFYDDGSILFQSDDGLGNDAQFYQQPSSFSISTTDSGGGSGTLGVSAALQFNGTSNVILQDSSPSNVGIGTGTPSRKLHVNGDYLLSYDDGAGNVASITNSGTLTLQVYDGIGNETFFELTNSDININTIGGDLNIQYALGAGNVGIGTNTPTETLDVAGTLKSTNGDFSVENTDLALLGSIKASVNKFTPTVDETYFSGVQEISAGVGLSQNGYINTNTTVGTFAYAGPTSASIQYKADYTSATDYNGVVAGATEVIVKSMATMDTEKVVSFENASGEVAAINGIGTFTAPTLTLTTVPAYDDDAAAGVGGLVAGQIYQTTGSGTPPLNVAGILMIKQ